MTNEELREYYQSRFRELCERVAKGQKVYSSARKKENRKVYQDMVQRTPITEDNFKMAYAELNESDPLYLCRKQLPKNWFVSKYGEVIQLERLRDGYTYISGTETWKESNRKQERRRYEKQYVIEHKYIDEEPFQLKYSERKGITGHALAGLIYGCRIFGKAKDSLRKWGIEAFSSKENGEEVDGIPRDLMVQSHHVRGYLISFPWGWS